MLLPLVFLVGLVFGARRWPAPLVFSIGWTLTVQVLVDHPPGDLAAYAIVVLVNAVAGMAIHEGAALVRRGIAITVRLCWRRSARCPGAVVRRA